MNLALAQTSWLRGLFRHKDLAVALGVVGIIVVMVIPMPTIFMDLMLALSISVSLVILIVSMYTANALEFSVFPGLLLVITLFRLALNVASTRLILGDAYAGEVINAFGTFVTKGNAVVGFVIFIIIVVIQFVVITKGAGRISEVAARFTLDAMPGKQMAIDADLNSGLINEAQARERRSNVSREADFYGAMDGASKFVRGDAVAGIIITLINILGGFVIGMAQRGMNFTTAISTYTLLSIGDGLVSQIPALIVSTASGLIVTRAASSSNLGTELTAQLFQSPKALFVTAGILGVFAIVPGLPFLPFLGLGLAAGASGYVMDKVGRQRKASEVETKRDTPAEPERVESYLVLDPMELEIGYGLIPLVDAAQGGDLLDRITMIRRQIAADVGIVVPPIRIRDNIQLKPNEYHVKIKGNPVGTGELMPGSYLAMDPGNVTRKIRGIATREPTFGLPALWITESQKEQAEMAGYTVVELPAVLATHLTEIIKNHGHDILSRQDVRTLVDNIKENQPALVEDVIPGQLSLGELHKVLQNLLRERISIRDLPTILETLSDQARQTKDPVILTEFVRNALARSICRQLAGRDNTLFVLTLDPRLEQALENAIAQSDKGSRLALPPQVAGRLLERVGKEAERVVAQSEQPVILCSPTVRHHLRRLLENSYPQIAVISYNEVAKGIEIKSAGLVSISDDGSAHSGASSQR